MPVHQESDYAQLAQEARQYWERLKDISELSADWFWEQDADFRFTYLSDSIAHHAKVPPEELIGKTRWELPYTDLSEHEWLAHRRTLEQHLPFRDLVYQVVNSSGEHRFFSVSGKPIFEEDGRFTGYRGIARDVTTRRKTEQALHESQKRFTNAFANAPIGMSLQTVDGHFMQVNRALCRITGYNEQELLHLSFWELTHPDDQPEDRQRLRDLIAGHYEFYQIEKRYFHKSGRLIDVLLNISLVRDEHEQPLYLIAQAQDITERKNSEKQLEILAQFDPLTGLPNRRLFNDRLSQAVRRANRDRTQIAVMFLDLDKFKEINDSLGHETGDRALMEAAARIRNCLRETDTVARISGDEFTVILEHLTDGGQAAVVAQKMLEAVSRAFSFYGVEYILTTSIGIALYPQDATEVDSLLRAADLAMYEAKQLGRNNYQFFQKEINVRTLEAISLKNDLRMALKRNELSLHYQPQVDVETGQIIGLEALIRWCHPTLGMVSPARFIPMAEEAGLITNIGTWVLDTACRQLKAWQDLGMQLGRVAVNLSVKQLKDPGIVTIIRQTLADTGLAAHCLEIEITEGILIEDIQSSITLLNELKAMGIKIALDDFGTGYSSLSYLKSLPLDVIKMDGSFVRHLTTNTKDAVLARTIISLAHSLNLDVIAEGVETEAQLSELQENACYYVQGYLFSRPLPVEEITPLLEKGCILRQPAVAS